MVWSLGYGSMTLNRVLVGIALSIFGMQVGASESRPLSDSEEADLRGFASKKAGVDAWYVHSSITELEGQIEAMALVVFEPASAPNHCLAPSATFTSRSPEGGSLVWESLDNQRVSYRFWFERCDRVNRDSAIILKVLLDFEALERIRSERDSIIDAVEKRLEIDRKESDPPSALQLSEIDLRYDTEQGPVYHIKYSLGYCFWLSANVVFEAGRAQVLDAWRVVC